ncbi:MAG: hypothetical protein K2P79_08505 [Sphingomonas sp.]|nr:hypothetical protein [Sphingomonas sp.]
MRALLLPPLLLLASGCVAKAVVGVATAPVKVAGKAIDWTTTSREEADRNAGRQQRKAEKHCRKHPQGCHAEPRLVPNRD